jgi:stalled ribosome alternative rescue factor ArfA
MKIMTVTGAAPAKRNEMAVALQSNLFRKQILKSKKGKGAYARRPKHAKSGW